MTTCFNDLWFLPEDWLLIFMFRRIHDSKQFSTDSPAGVYFTCTSLRMKKVMQKFRLPLGGGGVSCTAQRLSTYLGKSNDQKFFLRDTNSKATHYIIIEDHIFFLDQYPKSTAKAPRLNTLSLERYQKVQPAPPSFLYGSPPTPRPEY